MHKVRIYHANMNDALFRRGKYHKIFILGTSISTLVKDVKDVDFLSTFNIRGGNVESAFIVNFFCYISCFPSEMYSENCTDGYSRWISVQPKISDFRAMRVWEKTGWRKACTKNLGLPLVGNLPMMEPHWEAGTIRRRVTGGLVTVWKDDN